MKEKIKRLRKVVQELTKLEHEIGTLLAAIKLIININSNHKKKAKS